MSFKYMSPSITRRIEGEQCHSTICTHAQKTPTAINSDIKTNEIAFFSYFNSYIQLMIAKSKPKTKDQRFQDVASKRVNNVLVSLQSLQKCSNKNNYAYTDAQVKKMFAALQSELDNTKRAFNEDKSSAPEFHF